ncbi:MAG: HD domain-containing protein [Oscillospiraceae bacterium]|nr:HD domain-containing protein [Oscillospiraceae bacterium]
MQKEPHTLQAEDIVRQLFKQGYSIELDEYDAEHAKRTAMLTELMLKTLARQRRPKALTDAVIANIITAARLHNIGKALIWPKYEPITAPKEAHTTLGSKKMIEALWESNIDIDLLSCIFMVVRNHHERWDGKGYPDRLKGTKIPFAVQIVSLASYYDQLCFNRNQETSLSYKAAAKIITQQTGHAFSPSTVRLFLHSGDAIQRCFYPQA